VGRVCGELGFHRASYYEWCRRGADPPRKSSGPSAELIAAMKDEVRRLCHAKRRTWGTDTVYHDYDGLIPRRVIGTAIAEERRSRNQWRRNSFFRYEFVAPAVAFSMDFMFPGLVFGERLIRMQYEFSRFELQHESRKSWPDEEVVRWTERLFAELEMPYLLKHDQGSEFRSGRFQDMLRANKILPLPSPFRKPQYNGKHERGNGFIQDWMIPLARQGLTREEWLNEVAEVSEDLNELRPRGIFGYRTPLEVYSSTPRLSLDRDALYAEYETNLRELELKRSSRYGIMGTCSMDLDAMRFAALAVMHKHSLVRYFPGSAGPKV
jgi:hypothetical protein